MSQPDKTTAQDQFGQQVAGLLRTRADRLDPSIEARLATARKAALQAAQAAHAPELVAVAASGAGQNTRQRGRWTLLLPAALLLVGLLGIAHSQWLQETLGLADRDGTVLRDKLPPNAYGDPGFNEYLDEKPETETPKPDEEEANP